MQVKNGTVSIYDLATPTGVTITSSTGGTLTVGTTYYYIISAVYPTGESIKSTQVSRTGANAYQLDWSTCPGATYRIYRSTLAGGPYVYYTSTTNSYKDIKASGSISGTPLNTLIGPLNIVTGVGTNWLTGTTPIQVGNTFKIAGENVIYQIGLVNSDTQITLTSNYLGTSKVNSAYQITTEFTPNLGLAELSRGDVDLEYHLTQQVIRPLDTIIANMSDSLTKTIYQTNHGFLVKDVVRYNGTTYVKAIADTEANTVFAGIVTKVIDSNNFKIAFGGYITGLSGLTPDTTYYLSDITAGLLTTTAPVITKAIIKSNSTTSGYFDSLGGFNQMAATGPQGPQGPQGEQGISVIDDVDGGTFATVFDPLADTYADGGEF